MIEVEGPDGSIIEFPDGTDKAVMVAAMQKKFGAAQPADNSRLRGLALGSMKPVENINKALMAVPGVRAADQWMAENLGTTPYDELTAQRDAARSSNTRTGYQLAGNVLGTLPVAAITKSPTAQGAISGALLTDAKDAEGAVIDTLAGGLFGKVGDMAIGTAARLAKPYVSKGAEALRNAGVPMTLGQLAEEAGSGGGKIGKAIGSSIRGMEDRLSGISIIGDVIHPAQQRGVEAYNKAVATRALAAVGKNVPDDIPVGREMVKYVGDTLDDGYEALKPKLSATIDRRFAADLKGAWNDLSTLPKQKQDQFASIMDNIFVNRANGMNITGAQVKEVESKLAEYISDYANSTDGDQRMLGRALKGVRDGFRNLLTRTNPQYAKELQALNKGWAELSVLETAAAAKGSVDGVFTPKQYAAAARAADKSVRRRATARGTRPNQELTDAAADILPNKIPDSGTAGRAVAAGLGTGMLYVDPSTGALLTAGALPYTEMGQRLLNSLFVGQRGPAASAVGNALDQTRRLAAPVVAPLVPYLSE